VSALRTNKKADAGFARNDGGESEVSTISQKSSHVSNSMMKSRFRPTLKPTGTSRDFEGPYTRFDYSPAWQGRGHDSVEPEKEHGLWIPTKSRTAHPSMELIFSGESLSISYPCSKTELVPRATKLAFYGATLNDS